jgi:hypothetical protein
MRSRAKIVLTRCEQGTEPPQAIDSQGSIGQPGLTLRRALSFQYSAHVS